jgi:hypothetical protein
MPYRGGTTSESHQRRNCSMWVCAPLAYGETAVEGTRRNRNLVKRSWALIRLEPRPSSGGRSPNAFNKALGAQSLITVQIPWQANRRDATPADHHRRIQQLGPGGACRDVKMWRIKSAFWSAPHLHPAFQQPSPQSPPLQRVESGIKRHIETRSFNPSLRPLPRLWSCEGCGQVHQG